MNTATSLKASEETADHPNDIERRKRFARQIADDILKKGFSTIEENLTWIIATTMTATRDYDASQRKARKPSK